MSSRASSRELLARNGAQLFYCFVGSALLNVVSQAFFARAAPEAKDAWLSFALLGGTLASMLGVAVAKRTGLPGRPIATGVALQLAVATLLCAVLFVRTPIAFVAIGLALRFLLQYGTQELDRRAVAIAGVVDRRRNDLLGLGLRFGGMLLGPLWFGLVRDAASATFVVIAALTLLGSIAAVRVAGAPDVDAHAAISSTTPPLDAGDRAVLAGARAIYAAYYLLASSIIYVLADLHHAKGATTMGGVLVTLVYGAAIAATVVEMVRGRSERRSPLEMLPAAALMIVVGAALPLRVVSRTPVLLAGGALLGVAFARFQLAFRDHATHAALHRGRPALLAAYNDLANTSALLGYAIMAIEVGVCRALAISSARGVGVGVALLGVVAVPMVVAGARATRVEAARTRLAGVASAAD